MKRLFFRIYRLEISLFVRQFLHLRIFYLNPVLVFDYGKLLSGNYYIGFDLMFLFFSFGVRFEWNKQLQVKKFFEFLRGKQ